MDAWLKFFIALTAVALISQAVILVLTYLRLAKLDEETKALRRQVVERAGPILRNVEEVTLTVRENSRVIFDDLSALSYNARRQMDKFDRLSDELADRIRGQIVRVDQLLTQTLDNLQRAGTAVRENIVGPVQEAAAVIQGVKAAIDFLSARRGRAETRERQAPRAEEDLFI